MSYTIGVDIGGTFSDCVAVNDQGQVFNGKALSTHATDPVEGVIEGLTRLAEEAGETLESLLGQTTEFSHGTTIGTNLMVERKGARVGLVATKGHGDALQIMRGRGRTAGVAPELLLNVRETDKPAPLVPHRDVVEVAERVLADGSVLASLNDDEARAVLRPLLEQVDAVAISLIWSFRNPVHEQRLRELVHEIRPDMFVSISSETSPRLGEYERTVATVINSYVGPASSRYLGALETALQERGLTTPVFIMQSNGGVLPVETARHRPVQTIGSGPAGGLAATESIARRTGHKNVIATDMGGTSFEVGLLIDGRPILTSAKIIDQYTFKIPQLDLRSIACGGGSIARVDPHSGGLRVGPESAGSNPGPACYGRGTEATVTDADVVLGFIDPDRFLGSEMQLDKERAVAAVRKIAEEAELSLEQAASGILRVNSHSAAILIRQRTIEQGLDPRDFALYAFGGAGPLHAFAFAQELDIDQVVIPMGNGASTLSAYGIAASDAMEVFEEECTIRAPFDTDALAETIGRLEERALEQMAAAGFPKERVRLERSAQARYAEQYMQELHLPVPSGPIDESFSEKLSTVFAEEYSRLYSAVALSVLHTSEIFTIRVTASVPLQTAATATPVGGQTAPAREREVFWPGHEQWISTAVYDGPPALGGLIEGPALVQLPHTTIAVAPGQSLETDDFANCILHTQKQENQA
ncbi:hydantoinase/oxoprolinase family protein [Agromyces sp. Marseille-P2726]|uniref:hydantoinase/oxoprolinase family protein n=1 Tax=Agromyces sp. Marseille-P2726 TaxID=2709132 RepID=UPI0015706376|nr:hydantoinase/oxoprolinase family protein [Agromyces sp. Marseille-P2726]